MSVYWTNLITVESPDHPINTIMTQLLTLDHIGFSCFSTTGHDLRCTKIKK